MTLRLCLLSVALVFSWLQSHAAQPREVGVIDLTGITIEPRVHEPTRGSASGVSSSTGRRQPGKLSIQVLKISALTRESLSYEVKITNTSDHTIAIPWNPQPSKVEENGPSYQVVGSNLGFEVVAIDSENVLYVADSLYYTRSEERRVGKECRL